MRLINTSTLELVEFTQSEVPPYAILSHTWSQDEVSYRDLQKRSQKGKPTKKAFDKIVATCRLAVERSLKWAWVDTCCIDKSSSAELSESINSMYRWYAEAEVCLVYLEDLDPSVSFETGLSECRWCYRGWTLQELVAPSHLEFFDTTWRLRGSNNQLARIICESTKLPPVVITNSATKSVLVQYSAASRMSWAANRKTSRGEDIAYSLLGIFDVNLPLIYGEGGEKAFFRLQEEIIKHTNDLTILAWELPKSQQAETQNIFAPSPNDVILHDWELPEYHLAEAQNIFAPSPAVFKQCSQVRQNQDLYPNFSVANHVLLITSDHVPFSCVRIIGLEPPVRETLYCMRVGRGSPLTGDPSIYLRKVGPRLFYRDGTLPLFWNRIEHMNTIHIGRLNNCCIIIEPNKTRLYFDQSQFRMGALRVPTDRTFLLEDVVPETIWDATGKMFLRVDTGLKFNRPVFGMKFSSVISEVKVSIIVLCDFATSIDEPPICKVFQAEQYEYETKVIFERRNRVQTLLWSDIDIWLPHLLTLNDQTRVAVGENICSISVDFTQEHWAQHTLRFAISLDEVNKGRYWAPFQEHSLALERKFGGF